MLQYTVCSVYISHETDDLLVLVIDYCESFCTTVCNALINTSHDSSEYMTGHAMLQCPLSHSKYFDMCERSDCQMWSMFTTEPVLCTFMLPISLNAVVYQPLIF